MNNMSYKEQYQVALKTYQNMIADYEKAINSSKYYEILATMPFEFVNALHLCEKLSLYEKLEVKPKLQFTSLDEALVFYKSLITFHKKSEKLLEDASYIAEIGTLVKKINEYAVTNPYLGAIYHIEPNFEIINIAEKCLVEVPQYPKILTKKFRWNFIESAILSLDKEALTYLVQSKVIKSDDIDHISLIEDEEYQDKIAHLCTLLNHPQILIKSYSLKLKGVTFSNADGSSRQAHLIALKQYIEEHTEEVVSLTVEPYTYTPEIGNPEPAIRIKWGDKEIGNIAKDVVEDIMSQYQNPNFTATLEKISGGDNNATYGCTIKLNIMSPNLIISNEEIALE